MHYSHLQPKPSDCCRFVEAWPQKWNPGSENLLKCDSEMGIQSWTTEIQITASQRMTNQLDWGLGNTATEVVFVLLGLQVPLPPVSCWCCQHWSLLPCQLLEGILRDRHLTNERWIPVASLLVFLSNKRPNHQVHHSSTAPGYYFWERTGEGLSSLVHLIVLCSKLHGCRYQIPLHHRFRRHLLFRFDNRHGSCQIPTQANT